MDDAVRAMEARLVQAEQQIVERRQQEQQMAAQLSEARGIIDRLTAQASAQVAAEGQERGSSPPPPLAKAAIPSLTRGRSANRCRSQASRTPTAAQED